LLRCVEERRRAERAAQRAGIHNLMRAVTVALVGIQLRRLPTAAPERSNADSIKARNPASIAVQRERSEKWNK
jgi:hypothetical protein